MPTTVLIACKYPLFAEALATAIGGADGISVSASCSTGADAVDLLRRDRPAVVLLGPLADAARCDMVRLIRAAVAGTAVLVIADEQDANDLVAAMEAGATGYLTTACSTAQLADAVGRVAAGEVVVLGVGRAGAAEPARTDADRAQSGLTSREREILALICAGRSNVHIARELFISAHTVRTHIQNIRSKLNVRSKLEAALMALNGPGVTPGALDAAAVLIGNGTGASGTVATARSAPAANGSGSYAAHPR